MIRFHAAVSVAEDLTGPTLHAIATSLTDAIAEVIDEGGEPLNDPAVMLLGAFVAFHTHADVNTVGGFNKLVDMCHTRIEQRTLQ